MNKVIAALKAGGVQESPDPAGLALRRRPTGRATSRATRRRTPSRAHRTIAGAGEADRRRCRRGREHRRRPDARRLEPDAALSHGARARRSRTPAPRRRRSAQAGGFGVGRVSSVTEQSRSRRSPVSQAPKAAPTSPTPIEAGTQDSHRRRPRHLRDQLVNAQLQAEGPFAAGADAAGALCAPRGAPAAASRRCTTGSWVRGHDHSLLRRVPREEIASRRRRVDESAG